MKTKKCEHCKEIKIFNDQWRNEKYTGWLCPACVELNRVEDEEQAKWIMENPNPYEGLNVEYVGLAMGRGINRYDKASHIAMELLTM